VGSSNLNAASLLGNWEIDVGVMDNELAGQLEGLFLADLASSVEIVHPRRHHALESARVRRRGEPEPPRHSLDPEGSLPERLERELRAQVAGETSGSTGWRMADFIRGASVFGDAIAGHRALGREDRTLLGTIAVVVLLVAVFSAVFPWVVGWVLAVLLAWLGLVLGMRAFAQARRARVEEERYDRPLEPVDESS
jgi:cardiolipin synthase